MDKFHTSSTQEREGTILVSDKKEFKLKNCISQYLQKIEEEGICPNTYYKTRITLLPKPKTGEEKYVFYLDVAPRFLGKKSLYFQ